MPVTWPALSEVNFTPSSTDEVSGSLAVPGVAVDGQIVHAEHEVAAGVTALEAADCAPVPMAFVAATLKVYVSPFVRPGTVVLVAGGFPLTVVGDCAAVPRYGVTVYDVIA